MNKIIFQAAKDRQTMPITIVFKNIPMLLKDLDAWKFNYEDAEIDKFIELVSKYLIDEDDGIAPIAIIIAGKFIGVQITHRATKYNLIVRNEKDGGDSGSNVNS